MLWCPGALVPPPSCYTQAVMVNESQKLAQLWSTEDVKEVQNASIWDLGQFWSGLCLPLPTTS